MINTPKRRKFTVRQARAKTGSATKIRKLIDPFFKQILTEMALEAGLTKGPTELHIPRSSFADMLLIVPQGAVIQNILISFFRLYNMIEFKGQNDLLDKTAFDVQVARVCLWHSQNAKLADYDQILNVIVSSRYPYEVFRYSAERGSPFEKVNAQEWLWQARYGWQDIVIVVCEKLPIEKPFYPWLAFAPTSNAKWGSYVSRLVQEKEWDLLKFLFEMHGVEVFMNMAEIDKELAKYHPAEWARVKRNRWLLVEEVLKETVETDPEQVREAISSLPPTIRLAGLKPEDKLAGLKPEDRLAGLQPEEIQELLRQYAPQSDSKTNES